MGNDVDIPPPSPVTFDFDAHFGYSPTPSPPPEVALQLTEEQLKMGMFKVEDSMIPTNMGPPSLPFSIREDTKGGRTRTLNVSQGSKKRKERDSDGEDNSGLIHRKKSRG
jgi:hypothetical protein